MCHSLPPQFALDTTAHLVYNLPDCVMLARSDHVG